MTQVQLFILYGSATGNAESIAKDLAAKYRDCLPLPFSSLVCCEANDFKKKCSPVWEVEPPQDLATRYGLVFVTSTTGNGDSPENASRFIRYLKRKTTIESRPLTNVVYGVLGLGDTNYDKFCENAKVADKKLAECGAERVKELGMADEATGLEEVVDSWVQDIVPMIAQACLPEAVADSCNEEKKIEDEGVLDHVPNAHDQRRTNNNIGGARPDVQSILRSRMGQTVAVSSFNDTNLVSSLNDKDQNISTEIILENPQIRELLSTGASMNIKSPSPLFILYGSVTGNAEQIAKSLASKYESMISEKKNECYFPGVVCCELDQYKKKCTSAWEDDSLIATDKGQKHGVLIVTSTTGNGDSPENASRFTRFVKRKTTVDTLPFRHVAYAVLGLGDTNYDKFCETGKVIDRKLKELGGTRVLDIVCADEATGLEQFVDPWIDKIFDILSQGCMDIHSMKGPIAMNKQEGDQNHLSCQISPSLDDPGISQLPDAVTESTCTMSLPGITVVKQLLSPNCEIPKNIDNSLLPTLGSKLSSCQLYNGDEHYYGRKNSRGLSLSDIDRVTLSSCTSSNLHYTMNDPFESMILGARYLTNTSIEGVKLATEILESASLQDNIFDSRHYLAKKKIQETFNLKSEHGSKHGKRVIEMKLSLPDDFSLDFQPGDSIGMVISNSYEAVTFVLNMLQKEHGLSPTQQVILDNKRPLTVADAISNLIDLCSPIKNKRILLSLSEFAADQLDADVLKLLSSKDPVGQDLFKNYVDEQRLSVIDILKVFPSCQKIPLEGLFSVLPSLAPRYYSISSSPLQQEKNLPPYLTVTFSVVDYLTPLLKLNDGTQLQRRVGGLATSHLEVLCAPHLSGLSDNLNGVFSLDRVKLFPKPTADFRLPPVLGDPMLLIGPGTGVAPFIGFLRHREAQLTSTDSTKLAKVVSEGTWRGGFEFEKEDLPVTSVDAKGLVMGADYRQDQRIGNIALYFGCRFQDHDWLYKTEMEEFLSKGIISHLSVALSRDSLHPKSYVQDKLKGDADLISKMITEQQAHIYICGDGNAMAKDVQNVLIDILAQHAFGTDADATNKARDYLNDLKMKKKLLLDVWS